MPEANAVRTSAPAQWSRALWIAIAISALGVLLIAVVLQHTKELEPCPLCIIQRYAYLGMGMLAAMAALFSPRRSSLVAGVVALAVGMAGAGVAGRQVWAQLNPETGTCSYATFRLVNESLPAQWFPWLLRGMGDCLAADWTLLGLTMPQWSLTVFSSLVIGAWLALVLPRR